MNIVLDNIIFSIQSAGGVSVYWYSLVKFFQKNSDDLYYLDSIEDKNIFKNKLTFYQKNVISKQDFRCFYSRYENPKYKFDEKHIFHSSYYRISNHTRAINVLTIHDFIYEKKLRGIKRIPHVLQKYYSLIKAKAIICISNSTCNDMYELYPFTKKKMVKVIHNGFDIQSYFFKGHTNYKNYVLFVGGRTGYKNFYKAIEAVSLLKNINLFIVGSHLNDKEVNFLELKLRNKYKHYFNVDNSTLRDLYANAICLLYLSEYEGFGIPVLEAMASGCPVIGLNKSSIPEVAGKAAILFDTCDIYLISKEIFNLANDHSFRNSIIEKGLRQSSQFSWDKCAKETFDLYSKLMNQ
jgi:mannosyltransferase